MHFPRLGIWQEPIAIPHGTKGHLAVGRPKPIVTVPAEFAIARCRNLYGICIGATGEYSRLIPDKIVPLNDVGNNRLISLAMGSRYLMSSWNVRRDGIMH